MLLEAFAGGGTGGTPGGAAAGADAAEATGAVASARAGLAEDADWVTAGRAAGGTSGSGGRGFGR